MKGSFFVGLNFDWVVFFFFFLEVSNESNVCMIVWVLGWFICYMLVCYVMGVTGKRDWEEKGGAACKSRH